MALGKFEDPYRDDLIKGKMAKESDININQVNNWLSMLAKEL
jgi:hypothetical protein